MDIIGGILISIHTPAQGVTVPVVSVPFVMLISIHTPAQGVTQRYAHNQCCNHDFNPHSRTGSDLRQKEKRHKHQRISIHTPAQGVTNDGYREGERSGNFNPHSRTGSD